MPASITGCSMSKSSVSLVRIGPPWLGHTASSVACAVRSGPASRNCGPAVPGAKLQRPHAQIRSIGRPSRIRGLVDALFRGLGRGVVRFRWLVVVLWLVGTGAAVHALPSIGSEINNNNSAFLPSSAPSNQAADLAEPLTGPSDQSLIQVVFVSSGGTLSASDLSAAQSLASALRKV